MIKQIVIATRGALLVLLICGSHVALAFPKPAIGWSPSHYMCYRADQPLTVDGNLDESIWEQAAWSDDFVDIQGHLKSLPRFRTHLKMLWDDTYLYVGAELQEPHVWATLTQRDAVIYYDNDFEIFIDPDGDTHEYFEYEVNALGTVWDLFLLKPYRDGGPALNAWDIAGLKSAVHVNGTINDPSDRDTGWTIEVAIPWVVLKECAHKPSPPQPEDTWRLNFSRVEWEIEVVDGQYRKVMDPATNRPKREDNWVWSAQGLVNMHYPEMWGIVQFSDQVAGAERQRYRPDPEEEVRFALRRVYYEQRDYFEQHGVYAPDVFELGLHIKHPKSEYRDNLFAGYSWPPMISFTPSLFEAWVEREDGTRWRIDQSGRIWKTTIDK
jgi:Carbohydrate family 9 binding domain-like